MGDLAQAQGDQLFPLHLNCEVEGQLCLVIVHLQPPAHSVVTSQMASAKLKIFKIHLFCFLLVPGGIYSYRMMKYVLSQKKIVKNGLKMAQNGLKWP